MKKTADYYMGLRYTVKLKRTGKGYEASIEELPECVATVDASDSVEKLWRLLEWNQREWIEKELKMGREVPEPPGATRDPFWEDFEEAFPNFDGEDVSSMLYEYGSTYFPLRVLEKLWLQELEDVRLGEVKPPSGIPPKAEVNHYDQRTPRLKGDVRSVLLGKSGKGAWIRLDGTRTKRGYRNIEVLDKTLRTEAAIVAALTVLETSIIEDFDFERLRKALLEHVEAHPRLRNKNLREVLDELPRGWLSARKAEIDQELKTLDEKLKGLNRKKRENKLTDQEKPERKKLERCLPKPSWRGERSPLLWKRSMRYMLALLQYRRPDLSGHSLEQQLDLVDELRRKMYEFLEKQREYMAFLEYGTEKGTPTRVVERAQDQVRAAVLKDVEDLSHRGIADRIGITFDEERYKVNKKIRKVELLIQAGQILLGKVLRSEGGWQRRVKEMKAEAEQYSSLNEKSRLIERVAENMSWTIEEARSFCQANPGLAEFMATDFLDRRPQP